MSAIMNRSSYEAALATSLTLNEFIIGLEYYSSSQLATNLLSRYFILIALFFKWQPRSKYWPFFSMPALPVELIWP